MPTCGSCGSMIEADARECWHCGVELAARAVGTDPAAAAPTMDVSEAEARTWTTSQMIGREIIGQYVIRSKLGEGGMGEVYLADQPAIGRQVAIKVVHAQTREREREDHVERFRNEAKAAASLESPHIVQIFNWGELEDGTLFMAMEYLAGRTLAQLLDEEGSLDAHRTVAIAQQICTALAEAHAAGIVHRDLKPSNIMLIERGEAREFAKVLDFGIAKLEGSDITRSGAMFGTPQYMSPEQLRAEALDGRSDLYALGVMLYEMLAGELPFSSPTAVGFVTAHLHDDPPPLPRSVPRALAEVVMMLLAKEADERPPDAPAVAAELRAALGGRAPGARRRARRRALRRVMATVAILASLGALVGVAYMLWSDRRQTKAELERERARGAELERRVIEESEAARKAREQARAATVATRETTAKVREERRKQVELPRQRDKSTRKLDPKLKQMYTRTRSELEADLRAVLESRRVPPSEVADVLDSTQRRLAKVEAGELDEDELREDLISMILLYRKSFERKRAADRAPLDQLEQAFLSLATREPLSQDQRRAMLDAIYAEYDEDTEMSGADRDYFKRLAVAELIRKHVGEEAKAETESKSESPAEVQDAEAPKTADVPAPQPADGGPEEEGFPSPDEPEPRTPDEGALPSVDGP